MRELAEQQLATLKRLLAENLAHPDATVREEAKLEIERVKALIEELFGDD